MMDTYADRADAATSYRPTRTEPDYNSPLYFNGDWYMSMIHRNVAEAKYNLQMELHYLVAREKYQIQRAFQKAREK
jgi:hypothetical protein